MKSDHVGILLSLFFTLALSLFLWLGADTAGAAVYSQPKIEASENKEDGLKTNTADHSKFEALQKEFASGPEVTAACLSCHTEAAHQVQKTIHWTWLCPKSEPEAQLGKGGLVVNNFCISMPSNEPRCTSCHAGYGWKDKSFDFAKQENVDCLACHEQTGSYKKFPAGAGHPPDKEKVFGGNGKTYYPPDWNKVAQSVARPSRANCGNCHFHGGGGDGVKHGDLDSSMYKPGKNLDVHMDVEGLNFNCVRCHSTEAHSIAGRCYKVPAATDRRNLLHFDQIKRITCESCHSEAPHKTDAKLNDHTDKVACQTCHIPQFARALPTKMMWDWSKAGDLKDGKKYTIKDKDLKKVKYTSQKGEFRWEKNVRPEYYWFNGVIHNVVATDKIDPTQTVKLNWPEGSPNDPNARIYPFKVHRGKQPYDKVNKTMAMPKLFGPKGSGAYWQDYDWKKALTLGMEYVGLPFSGEHDFVETEYYFQTTHMVAPKENALSCAECHAKQGRMMSIAGVYLPGRDANSALNYVGWAVVLITLGGVCLHGLGRIFMRNGKK